MINKIIHEVITKYISANAINESLTTTVYHFSDLKGLLGVCRDNAFFLTSSNTNQSDIRMSTRGGIPTHIICVLVVQNHRN